MQARGETFKGWRVSRRAFFIFGGQLGLMVLTSWVVSASARSASASPLLMTSCTWCTLSVVLGFDDPNTRGAHGAAW